MGASWREQGWSLTHVLSPWTPVHTTQSSRWLSGLPRKSSPHSGVHFMLTSAGEWSERRHPRVTPSPPEGAAGTPGHVCSVGRHGGHTGQSHLLHGLSALLTVQHSPLGKT